MSKMIKKAKIKSELLFKLSVILINFVITISIVLTMSIIFVTHGIPNYQPTDIKAISSISTPIDSKDDILFKYENSKSELCVFASQNDEFCFALLSKINLFGKVFYNKTISTDEFFTTYEEEYEKAGKDLYYIFLPDRKPIDDIDSCGYTPEEHRISYVDGSGDIHYGRLYVVDTENNHTSNQKFTNYSDSLYI